MIWLPVTGRNKSSCKMFAVLCGVLLISSVYGAGQFSILSTPESVKFSGHEQLRESTLKGVYSAVIGFSTKHYSNWRGLEIRDPFDLPEAIVSIVVDGVSDIGVRSIHSFPLKTDEDESEIYDFLDRSISEHYPRDDNNLIRVNLADGVDEVKKFELLQGIDRDADYLSVKFLKLDAEEDRRFLEEVSLLHGIAKKIKRGFVKPNNIPDVFWFKVTSLHALRDLHGENSTEVTEAKQLLNEAIHELANAFVKAYEHHALVTVITSDVSHTRRTRSLLQAESRADDDETDKTKYNLASYYNKDYPVIFNIILWFGVMMLFSLIAICLAIGNMDPGRDSIIYRMTSTRIKKEN